jgi:hypothetical protein
MNTLDDEQKEILFNVDIRGFKDLKALQKYLHDVESFRDKLNIEINAKVKLEEATDIRNDLSGYMETYSEQGYFTVTQTASMLEEHPDYINYLVKEGD